MAIKVIRPSPILKKTREITCRHCEAILSVGHEDWTLHYDQKDGDYCEIFCPECTKPITRKAERADYL
jgi:RNase P subunit RPR2